MKKILHFLLFFFCLTGCFLQDAKSQNQVCFDKNCINVEVVQKEEDLQRGLQFRTSLEENSGMLFIFAHTRQHGFWMKDTLIPLDMIWMDYNRRIVHIARNVPPCKADPCATYTPSDPALYVLEVDAGYASTLGLKVGNHAEFFVE